jgi:hypothetical protein
MVGGQRCLKKSLEQMHRDVRAAIIINFPLYPTWRRRQSTPSAGRLFWVPVYGTPRFV